MIIFIIMLVAVIVCCWFKAILLNDYTGMIIWTCAIIGIIALCTLPQ